jgi:PTH2 family peptidyl-tRNA hydrolase
MKTLLMNQDHAAMKAWLADKFTKICVRVDSEAELFDVYNKAKEAGLIVALIQDAGLTEFGGVPTYTCVAVGPASNEELQPITGHLKLL